MRQDGYLPIGAYAAIGDGRTLALVGSDGSIDWMCLPDLDAPSVFGALLDPDEGGRFVIQPAVPFEVSRSYVERANVLQTTFTTAEGRVMVTDALTLDPSQTAPWRELARRVEGLDGEVPMRWTFAPRFGGAGAIPELEHERGALIARGRGLQLGLQCWGTKTAWAAGSGTFVASPSNPALLVMTATQEQPLPLPDREASQRRLQQTAGVWSEWVSRHSYRGPWRDAVERSLLVIRLLTDGRTGAIAAAGTSSLPEVLGGERNFDYRFGWVRDASFALDAMLAVGMGELTQASVTWLLRAVAHTHPRVDPVYRLNGQVLRSQQSVDLPGYRGTTPVRRGNDAGSQLQLGGFGDLLEMIHKYVVHGHVLDRATGERLADVVDLLCHIWRRPDAGLWELSDYADYGTSKLGCWVAIDRVLDLTASGAVPTRHRARWRTERDAIRRFIDQELWSEAKGSYLQKPGDDALDCGMLLAARRGFGDPRGPRLNGTIDAVRRELDAGDGLLYRYSGMQTEENAFLACSFWLVEALAIAGRVDDAAELMEQLLPLSNDLGLYSEEIEPLHHRLRGNYPQALTHLALINAAAAFSAE